jgi:hypothetical protein
VLKGIRNSQQHLGQRNGCRQSDRAAETSQGYRREVVSGQPTYLWRWIVGRQKGTPSVSLGAVIPPALTNPFYFFLSRGLLKLNPLMVLFPGWVTVLEDVSQQSPKVRPIVFPVVPGGKVQIPTDGFGVGSLVPNGVGAPGLCLGEPRYRLSPEGRRLSVFFREIYTRIVTPSPRYYDPGLLPEVSARAPVARAWRDLDHALNDLIAASGVAA